MRRPFHLPLLGLLFALLLSSAHGQTPIDRPFVQGGAGAVPRTMQDKARDVINAKDYGAKCDGAANDSVPIQRAINFAVLFTSGAKVTLPPGLCIVPEGVVWPAGKPVNISGSGMWSTALWQRQGTNTNGALKVNGGLSTDSDIDGGGAGTIYHVAGPTGTISDMMLMSDSGPALAMVDASNVFMSNVYGYFAHADHAILDGNGGFENYVVNSRFGDSDSALPAAFLALVAGHPTEKYSIRLEPRAHVVAGVSRTAVFTEWQFVNVRVGYSATAAAVRIKGTDYLTYSSFGHTFTNVKVDCRAGTPLAITTASWLAGTATITETSPHPYQTGDFVRIAGFDPGGYNGTYVVTSTGASTYTYALTSNPGALVTPGTSRRDIGIHVEQADLFITSSLVETAAATADCLRIVGGGVNISNSDIGGTIRTIKGTAAISLRFFGGHTAALHLQDAAIDRLQFVGVNLDSEPSSLSGSFLATADGTKDFLWVGNTTGVKIDTISDVDAWGPRVKGVTVYAPRPLFEYDQPAGGGYTAMRLQTGPTAAGHFQIYDRTNGRQVRRFVYNEKAMSVDVGDAPATLTVGTAAGTVRWSTPLTANRAVTLDTTGAQSGDIFRIVREASATGAFNLNVGTGPLKALAVGTWCVVEYDGAAWRLTAYGAL